MARDKAADGKVVPLRTVVACPICGKDSAREYHPFCSRRCATIDLNRWLSGSYAIPAEESGPERESGDDEV